jgi:hypothetical protein
MNLTLEELYMELSENSKEISETILNIIQIIKKQNEEIDELKIKINKLEARNK